MASKMPSVMEYERKKPIPTKLPESLIHKEFDLIFNLSFETGIAYSLAAIADKGNEVENFTSWNLRNKAIYLETSSKRYELARNISDYSSDEFIFNEFETFSFSELLNPIEKDNDYMNKNNVPLSPENVQILFDKLDFQDIEFGETFLKIKDMVISNLKSFKYYTYHKKKKN